MANRAWAGAAAIALLAGLAASFALDRLAPFPLADVTRGSEDAFVSGLHEREFSGTPRRPERWTTGRVEIRFDDVPRGPRTLEVAVYRQRGPVAVAVDGVIVGALAPGVAHAQFPLPARQRDTVTVELRTQTFLAGDGRRLGAYFDRVLLRHDRRGLPSAGLLAGGLLAALGALIAAGFAGLAPPAAAASAVGVVLLQTGLLWPCGLVRSGYADLLPWLLVFGAFGAAAFARWRGARSGPELASWAYLSLLLAFAVQAVVLTSPMVVMSDAVFHANRLRQVAGGDFFPVSQTQHARPFRFPYGVSFYALLAPLSRAGLDAVGLVRYGAGLAAVAGSAALFVLAERTPRRAALAVLLALAMPISADVHGYGNLSNIFGQAVSLGFLGWWLRPRGGPAVGALLLLAGALAHLSSLIFLAVAVPLLVLAWRPWLRLGRARLAAVAVAAGFSALYYWQFLPLLLEQLPRLREGGGSGARQLSFLEALFRQGRAALGQWGLAITALAAFGLPRPARGDLDRLLGVVWWSGALLAGVALVSPLEVRYLYAVSFAVALAAAQGAERLAAWRPWGGYLALAAVGVQLLLALRQLSEILLERYRP